MIGLRHCGLVALAGFMAAVVAPPARADFPDHPIHLLVGEAPGGGTDLIARFIGQRLAARIGQPVLVENRPGGGGSIATGYVAHAAPDGYTIVEISGDHTTPPIGYTPSYDPVKSFAPITEIGVIPLALVVNPSVPVNSLQDFVAYAKANPGKLNLGDTGTAATGHWATALLMKNTGISLVNISFSGGALAQVALLGNEVQLTFSPMSTALPMVKAGKLKALAITGGARSQLLPDVPTFGEADMKDFGQVGMFYGLLAPAGTPNDVVGKLHDNIVAIIDSDEFRDAMAKRSFLPHPSTPEEFRQLIAQSIARWSDLKASIGATAAAQGTPPKE